MGASSQPHTILSAEAVSCGGGPSGERELRNVTVSIQEKTLNLLFGEPGCHLLLRMLGLLEVPEEGDILYRETPTRSLSEQARATIRNQHFGFLFAEPYLLPSFSVVENVAIPFFRISAVDTGEARKRTRALLDFVGLGHREQSAVAELSPAELQRVSLARALVNQPEILMVEAIDRGSDDANPWAFCGTLRRAAREFAATVIVTASSNALAKTMDNSFEISRGSIRLVPEEGGVRA